MAKRKDQRKLWILGVGLLVAILAGIGVKLYPSDGWKESSATLVGSSASFYTKDIGSESRAVCYVLDQHVVASVEHFSDSEPGGNLTLLTKPKNERSPSQLCQIVSSRTIWEVENSGTEAFVGMLGHLLFTDSGTGVQGRIFRIYDWKNQKKIFSTSYENGLPRIANGMLVYKVAQDSRVATFESRRQSRRFRC